MLKPIKKPPYYTTTIDPVRTKYEIEAMLKTYGAEAVQWTEIYEKQHVEVKFIMEIEVDGKPFKGVFSFKPRPLYMVKTPYRGSRQERKGVINWAATFRLLKNYLENMLNFISWGGIEGFQALLGHALIKGQIPVSEALKQGVFKLGMRSLEALPEEEKQGQKAVDAEYEVKE